MLLQNHELKKPKFHAIIPSSKAVRNPKRPYGFCIVILSSPFQPDGHAPPGCFYAAQPAVFGRGAVFPSNGTARVQDPCAAPLPGTRQRLTQQKLSFLLPVYAGIYQNFNPAPTWRGILLQKGGETWHTNATRLGGPRSTRAWKRSKAKLMPISPPARGTP